MFNWPPARGRGWRDVITAFAGSVNAKFGEENAGSSNGALLLTKVWYTAV